MTMGFPGGFMPGLPGFGQSQDMGTAQFLNGPMGQLTGGNTPQQHGYGISQPTDFTPYSTGPGLQDGNGQGYEGMDLSKAGMGEKYAQSAMGQYGDGKNPQLSGNQQAWFDQFKQNMPNIAEEPGFGAYYDRARTRQTADMNKQLAARGAYGSSVGLDQISQGNSDLNAQQANREADYNLQRIGEQRNWQGLGGQLASGADQQSQASSNNQLNWMQGLGNLAMGGQQAGQDRGQQLLQNNMGIANQLAGLQSGGYGDMISGDRDLMDASMGMDLGLGAEALNQDRFQQQDKWNQAQNTAGLMGSVAGGMLGK